MIRLASFPPKPVTSGQQSVPDSYRSKNSPPMSPQVTQPTMHRPIPAPEPNPEPNPAPDGVAPPMRSSHASADHISDEDWDQLFQAVVDRLLARCVDQALHQNSQLPLLDSLAIIQATVLACVNDMKLLHASLKIERQKWREHERHQQYQELEKQQQSSGRAHH